MARRRQFGTKGRTGIAKAFRRYYRVKKELSAARRYYRRGRRRGWTSIF